MVRIVHMKTMAMTVMAASLIAPVATQAQTMTPGESVISTGGSIPFAGVYGVVPSYGGVIPAGNGYDPMESARQVTNGSQTMMDASMANTRNAERALSNDSNSSDESSADDAQAKAAAEKKKTEAAAASAMGGDLAGDPTQSIMDDGKAAKSKSVDDDAAKAAAEQDPASMSPEDKARAAEVKAALAHADSYFKKPAATTGKTAGTAASSSAQKIFSGYAHALDTITLSVAGQTVVLDHMSGPGSQEVCFRDALPWSCGEDGRDVTERAVSGVWMACRLSSGNHGQCYTQDGENVANILLRRGYASRT